MVAITITVVICASVLAAIYMLQHKGLPVVHIKREEVQPPVQFVPYTDVVIPITTDPEEPTPKEKKAQAYNDPMALIDAYLKGDVDIGI